MPRLNTGSEIFRFLESATCYRIVGTPTADAVASGAIDSGDTTIPVDDDTGFADADFVLIIGTGGQELVQLNGAPVTDTLTLKQPAALSHAAGARVVKATAVPLGHIDENGVTYGGTQQLTPVPASTSRTPIAHLPGDFDSSVGFGLRNYNNQNVQMAFAADETETGTGTASDPHTSVVGGHNVGTAPVQTLRLLGTRLDLKKVQLDINEFQLGVNANIQVGATQPAVIPIEGKFGNLVQRIYS